MSNLVSQLVLYDGLRWTDILWTMDVFGWDGNCWPTHLVVFCPSRPERVACMACYCRQILWHESVKLFFANIGTFQHSQKGPPNRTFAAEESLPTAYKLIELCSLSDVMSLPRGALGTEKNSLPRRACKLLPFWQHVSSLVKLEWKDNCSYTFREYKTRNSKIVTVGN